MDVKLFEEHSEIGRPDHCAGLVGCKNFNKLYNPPKKIIRNTVKGAVIHYDHGQILISRNIEEAHVIDRAGLDQYLACKAVEKGVQIRLNQRVKYYVKKNGFFKLLSANGETFTGADIIVNTAGVNGLLSRNLNHNIKYSKILPGIQYELNNVKDISKDNVELYFNNNLTPGFFSWIIPLDEESVRVGLAAQGSKLENRLQYFIRKIGFNTNRFKQSKITAIKKGLIITGGPLKKTYYDGEILIGDAAAQVKPVTGGGLILTGLCATIAAEILIRAVEAKDFSSSFLSRYQTGWRCILSRELKYTRYVRILLDRLDNTRLTEFFNKIQENRLESSLILKGDIDFQSQAIKSVIKNPRFIKLTPLIFLAFSKHFLNL